MMPNERPNAILPLRGTVVLCASLLFLPSLGSAGPIATLDLKDGRKIDAEIQWFFEGRFAVRDLQTDEIIELEASSIRAIDFGEDYRESSPARPLTVAEIRTQAEKQHFLSLLRGFLRLNGARLKELDGALRQELERPALSADDRRDLSLARVLSLWAMGQEESARGLFAKIRADHPADPVVKRFDGQMHSVNGWVIQPPLPLPEKKP
jgi:hypothetical protein